MHPHEKNAFSSSRVPDTRYRTIVVSKINISSAIDFFRKQVVAGAMKIFYLDMFDTGIKKSLHNGIDVAGHFHTGPGPLPGHK